MNEICFLPPSFIADQARRRRRYRQGLLIVAVLMAMALWHYNTQQRVQELEQYAQTVAAQADAAKLQVEEVKRLRVHHHELTNQVAVHRQVAMPIATTQILDVLAQLMPESVALTKLELDTQVPDPEPPQEAEDQKKSRWGRSSRDEVKEKDPSWIQFQITAMAPNNEQMTRFVKNLNHHPLFEQVKLFYSEESEHGQYRGRSFRVNFQVPLDCEYRFDTQEVAHVD